MSLTLLIDLLMFVVVAAVAQFHLTHGLVSAYNGKEKNQDHLDAMDLLRCGRFFFIYTNAKFHHFLRKIEILKAEMVVY